MSTSPQPTRNVRRDAAREKARAMREAEARAKRRRRTLGLSGGIIAALVVAALIALAVSSHTSASSSAIRPPGVGADNGITTGKASAAHTVVIYQDYQCPYCKAFEASANPWLEKQVAAGTLRLQFRPIAFLDASSDGNRYSSRAANAAGCIAGDAQKGTVSFPAWNDAMYAQQPAEGSDGRPDSTLVAIARKAGAPASIASCISSDRYAGWVTKAKATAFGPGKVTGTPTVLVDGHLVGAAGTVPTLAQVQAALGMAS